MAQNEYWSAHIDFVGTSFNVLGYDDDSCSGCPVSTRTRQAYCEGSPYEAFEAFETEYFSIQNQDEETKAKYISLAQAELDFLKSLLPDTKKLSGLSATHLIVDDPEM